MKTATAGERRPQAGREASSDVETQFHVLVSPTEVEGLNYLEIDARRVFSSTQELQTWLNACVKKLASELSKSSVQ